LRMEWQVYPFVAHVNSDEGGGSLEVWKLSKTPGSYTVPFHARQ